MVCKEDIYSWFRESVSSQRIDLICGLLQLCLPLELRFVGSCVEEQARKDYCRLIDYETKANDVAEYELLATDVDVSGGLQKTLSVYVALLRSNNTRCALRLFDILTQLWNRFQSSALRRSACHHEQFIDGQVASDLLLLYTMTAYHPSFSFSQRVELYHMLDDVEKLLCDCNFILDDCLSRKYPENCSVGKKLHTCSQDVACQTSTDADSPNTSPVQVKEVNVRRIKGSSYHLKLEWSDGSCTEASHSFQDLKATFDDCVKLLLACDGDDTTCSPQFPYEKMPPLVERHTLETIRSAFRDLLVVPLSRAQSQCIAQYFNDLVCESERTSSADLCTLSPRRPLPTASQSSDSVVVTKMHADWPVKQSSPLSTVAHTSPASHYRYSDLSSSVCVTSSKSSPMLTSQRASNGSRSRHGSPVATDTNNVVAWLKEMRLHKYTELAKFTWDELCSLKDEQLLQLGLTSGACKKFLSSIESRRLQALQGCGSTSGRSSRGMHGEPGPYLDTYSRSSSVASPVNIDSSCGSECSTSPGSPDGHHSHVRRKHNSRATVAHLHNVEVDNDAGASRPHDGNSESSYDNATLRDMSPMIDGHWLITSNELPQSTYCDHPVARLLSPVPTSSPLPYFATLPQFEGDQRRPAVAVNSRPEHSAIHTLPVPPDAVLVRPRMPLVADHPKTTSPVAATSLPVDDGAWDPGRGSNSSTVYGGGFYAPPAQASSVNSDLAAVATFSCCPHCGMGFATAPLPRNIVYRPTGPSYVIQSFTPTYSVRTGNVVRPPPVSNPAGVRLLDSVYQQQTCTRPSITPSFASASPSINAVRVRTARPPPSCANCGHIGHTQLDCKEPTIDTVLHTRQFHLDIVPKTCESE